jgi:hypothetical protein
MENKTIEKEFETEVAEAINTGNLEKVKRLYEQEFNSFLGYIDTKNFLPFNSEDVIRGYCKDREEK